MSQTAVLFTYDDYLVLPENGKRHEIIDGELLMTPAPSPEHQMISSRLHTLLSQVVREFDLGLVLYSPLDVVLSMTDIVQPDLVYIRRERNNIVTKKNVVAAPDLVIEILSESTEKTDRVHKKILYERHGVQEYWIVDPVQKSVEVYNLDANALTITSTFKGKDSVRSALIPQLSFPASYLFES
jgi:Uma2 family endonuclease